MALLLLSQSLYNVQVQKQLQSYIPSNTQLQPVEPVGGGMMVYRTSLPDEIKMSNVCDQHPKPQMKLYIYTYIYTGSR